MTYTRLAGLLLAAMLATTVDAQTVGQGMYTEGFIGRTLSPSVDLEEGGILTRIRNRHRRWTRHRACACREHPCRRRDLLPEDQVGCRRGREGHRGRVRNRSESALRFQRIFDNDDGRDRRWVRLDIPRRSVRQSGRNQALRRRGHRRLDGSVDFRRAISLVGGRCHSHSLPDEEHRRVFQRRPPSHVHRGVSTKALARLRQLDLFGDDNALIFLDRTPKGRHYTRDWSSWFTNRRVAEAMPGAPFLGARASCPHEQSRAFGPLRARCPHSQEGVAGTMTAPRGVQGRAGS